MGKLELVRIDDFNNKVRFNIVYDSLVVETVNVENNSGSHDAAINAAEQMALKQFAECERQMKNGIPKRTVLQTAYIHDPANPSVNLFNLGLDQVEDPREASNPYTGHNPLTEDALKAMEPDTEFASGIITDERLDRRPVRWIAVRGGTYDWAIYYNLEHLGWNMVFQGMKVRSPSLVQELIPCTVEALNLYRQ